MQEPENAKRKLEEYKKMQEDFWLGVIEKYELEDDYEDAESVESGFYGGEIDLEWYDNRDVSYADDVVRCQEQLVRALEMLENGDSKAIHNANKTFETLVRDARIIKKGKTEDIQKAEEVIAAMDEIIAICDKHRDK